MAEEKLDVIIFGATGFTGKYTVFEAVSVLEGQRWGIAGRNRSKLETVLKDMGAKANKNLSSTPIILAEVEDDKSLLALAKRCRVLVNCCGPYRFFGEQVVRACIEADTHHVDVSGESQYMESMQIKYHKQAQEKGVYIISACGFESIPTEMGISFIEKNFDGVVNSVETYLKTYNKGGERSDERGGASVHYGTWESAVYGLGHLDEMPAIRAELYPERLPEFLPILKPRPLMFRSDIVGGVCLPFPSPDCPVVMNSQRYLYKHEQKRPVQMHAYVTFGSWLAAIMIGLIAVNFSVLAKVSFGRRLLLKYPKFFSLGFISHEGPTEASMERAIFEITMKANGWPKSDRLAEASDQFTEPPSKQLMVKVSGPNPGYGSTCVALLCTAKTILNEHDKMPGNGGVLPPGAAFAKTSLINELGKHEHGIKFEILANK